MEHQDQDHEIRQYRDLMGAPREFIEGVSWKMVAAAIFLGLVMVPASIYLSLFVGSGMGPAAQWVTVILFAEMARRSMKELRVQEVFLLFYMVGIAVSGEGFLGGSGIITQPLWNQYLIQSQPANGLGIATQIPWWIAPSPSIIHAGGRSFFTSAWLGPLLFIGGMLVINRVNQFGLGYALYRWTAHVEKLPFPMAPVGALGLTALAEGRDGKEKWRWRCFSIGGMLGMIFGCIYIGLPVVTQALFGRSVSIIPIPWLDLTPTVISPNFLPAVPMNFSFDLGLVLLGMVLPFWAVVGGIIGLVATWILNPMLYRTGELTTWQPGMGVVDTLYSNTVDFYLSFSIGLAFAVFFMSLGATLRALWMSSRSKQKRAGLDLTGLKPNFERGDLSVWLALGIYVLSTLAYIGLSLFLMPGDPVSGAGRFPWAFFLGFSFLYLPVMNYVNAKLEGMVGQNVQIPMVQQAAYILSGYHGAQIWFAPVPMNDFSESVRQFRVMELTGTKVWGVIKIYFIALPTIFLSLVIFNQLIWNLGPVPSRAFPFADQMWRLQALNFSLTVSSTSGGVSPFMEAIKPKIIAYGFLTGVGSFGLLNFLKLPTFLIYGAVRGLNQSSPGGLILELLGALIGRYYLERKLGPENYKRYMMVVFAGFSAGVGIVGMISVGIALLTASASSTSF